MENSIKIGDTVTCNVMGQIFTAKVIGVGFHKAPCFDLDNNRFVYQRQIVSVK